MMTRLTAGVVALCGFAAASAAVAPAAGASAAGAIAPLSSSREGVCATSDTSGVTLVIDYQQLGGGVATYCVSGLTASATGWDVLKAAGVSVAGTVHDGQSFVCRLNGRPGPGQTLPVTGDPDYVEKCVDTPPQSAYWSYWWARPGGQWTYSQVGSMSHRVVLGGFEGWSFALNATPSTIPQPRQRPVRRPVPAATKTPRPSTSSPPSAQPAPTSRSSQPADQPSKDPSPASSKSDSGSPLPSVNPSDSNPGAAQPSQVVDLSLPEAPPPQSGSNAATTALALLALVGLVLAAAGIVVSRRRASRDPAGPAGTGQWGR